MKRVVAASVFVVGLGLAASASAQQCTTIQSGELKTSTGAVITTGYDQWGYNYQAHMFNGKYCDAYRNASWCQPYVNDDLEMKWNDAWMSNKDCDGDGLLDRPDDTGGSFIGTGAWTTNHQKGTYLDAKGKTQHWDYFVKIVAAPADARLSADRKFWIGADGSTIGQMIWGEFAVVQEVYNDTGTGDHGVSYLSPYAAGLGKFTPTK